MLRLKTSLTILCVLLCSASIAWASPDGEAHGESWSNLAFRIGNLVLFLGIIAYFFGKKIKAFFKGRTESIQNELTSLDDQKLDAQKKLEDVEKRIGYLQAERESILAEYRAQGEAIKDSIIKNAEKSAEMIANQAKVTAQNEINAAVEAMRAEMADKIAEATEELIAKKLSEPEHIKLIDKYLTKVVLN